MLARSVIWAGCHWGYDADCHCLASGGARRRDSPAMLKVVDYPNGFSSAGAFADVGQVTGAKEGSRVALRALTVNEPLHSANVSAPGVRPDLSEAVNGGMRAVSLRSNDVVGVAGFVLPGDRVDILLIRQTGNEKADSVTQVLAENVLVLGVDQSSGDQATKPSVAKAVTVEVTPDQSELISLARAVGEISLTLRHATDDAPLAHRAMTAADLAVDLPRKAVPVVARQVARVAPPPPPAAPPPPPPTVVRVVRGVDATSLRRGIVAGGSGKGGRARRYSRRQLSGRDFSRHELTFVCSAAAFAAAVSIICAQPAGAQTPLPTILHPPMPVSSQAVIGVSKSTTITVPAPYTDVFVADPKIADVTPIDTHTVSVVGKTMGATVLTIYGANKTLLMTVNVVVSADIEDLKAQLHQVVPAETAVSVSAANPSLVLSGAVSSPAALQQIVALAESYDPGKIVNLLSVQGTQQVMLSVRFVEITRTAANDLRINVNQSPTTAQPQIAVTTGNSLINAATSALNSFGNFSLLFRSGGGDLTFLFDALEAKGLIKKLSAEPTLVALSGDTASFLAGGQFPVPVNAFSNNGTGTSTPFVTIEFKDFGVSLAFTPTILADGLVNMVINPEVSSIDPTTAVTVAGVSIPGLKVRRAHTTVELRDGESSPSQVCWKTITGTISVSIPGLAICRSSVLCSARPAISRMRRNWSWW